MTPHTARSCSRVALAGLVAAAAALGACHFENAELRHRALATWASSTGGGGTGGAGGSAGSGGTGGAGGAGGAAPTCLDSAEHADAFVIETEELCLVGKYDAAVEVGFFVSPTWGRHGGPLTASYEPAPTDEAVITRWQLPYSATGTLTAHAFPVSLGITSAVVFFGAQALDLPFEDWTLLSWTGAFGTDEGEAILLAGTNVAERHGAVGWFAATGLGDSGDDGRVLHTSLTALGQPAATQVPALYAADFCVPATLCATSTVAAWGEASGPIAVDQDSNVFALQTTFSTDEQSLRAFEASTVAPSAGPTAGDELVTLPGYGSELAALSPDHASPGLVLFQPFDGMTYEAQNVVAVPYAVAGGSITAMAAPSTLLSMVTANTPVTLMTDDASRLWVGMVTATGETTFYVLGRTP